LLSFGPDFSFGCFFGCVFFFSRRGEFFLRWSPSRWGWMFLMACFSPTLLSSISTVVSFLGVPVFFFFPHDFGLPPLSFGLLCFFFVFFCGVITTRQRYQLDASLPSLFLEVTPLFSALVVRLFLWWTGFLHTPGCFLLLMPARQLTPRLYPLFPTWDVSVVSGG